jgi:hypothetical protein
LLCEYSAVVTNKALGGPALWAFMAGRGIHEKGLRGTEERLRIRLRANHAVRGEQRLAAPERPRLQPQPQLPTRDDGPPSRKRRTLFSFETIHTLRALCFQRAGLLAYPQGRAILDVGLAPAVVDRFERLDRLLAA